MIEAFSNVDTNVTDKQLNQSKIDKIKFQQHRQNLVDQRIENIPLEIISPITHITWLWLCPNWRNKLDFNFKRPSDWNDDNEVIKFNHSKYIQRHNMYDWHDWARLTNQTEIFAGVIVDPHLPNRQVYYYIKNIKYQMTDELKEILFSKQINTKSIKTWAEITKADYIPDCLVDVQELTFNNQIEKWVLSAKTKQFNVIPDFNWTGQDPSVFVGKVVSRVSHGVYQYIDLDTPDWQHPDVASNKPFLFSILSFDKYQHTQFTGVNSMNTHGCYWWVGNIDSDLQFTNKYTMITAQAPGIIDFETIVSKIFLEWQHLMEKGILLPTDKGLITMKGMVSHSITDMQDKDVLQRKRGCSKGSSCDGISTFGCKDGVQWPDECPSLLELHSIIRGGYALEVIEYVKQMNYSQAAIDKALFPLSLTTAKTDVFNNLDIDSTLKAPPEINHTTVLGCVKEMFLVEFTRMHDTGGGYDELFTRAAMIAYLNKYWVGYNGRTAFLADQNTNITVFNQIHHSYKKLIEIMISLPHICNWDGGVYLLCGFIRMTGCLHTCRTENRRKWLIPIAKDLCREGISFVCVFVCFVIIFFCFVIFMFCCSG